MVVCNLSCLVLVLGFLLFASSCYGIPVKQMEKICRETEGPEFCLKVLKSKPNASMDELIEYAMDLATASVTQAILLIYKLIGVAEDEEAKKHYESCLVHFYTEGALGDITYCRVLFKRKDYEGMNVAVVAMVSDVEDCISGESPTDPAYNDSSDLPKRAAAIEFVADILLGLLNNLGH